MLWGRGLQRLSAAVLLLGTTLVLPAHAGSGSPGGFYISAAAGTERPEGQNITQNVISQNGAKQTTTTSSGNLQYGAGFIGTFAAGYALANGLRPELEISNRHSSTIGVGENVYASMANLWYDIAQNGYFFYLGGGIGDAELHLNTEGQATSVNNAAWQVGAGFGFVITPHLAASVDYRHLETLNNSNFVFPIGGSVQAGYSSNALMLGLRYAFGGRLSDAAIMPVDDVKMVPLPR